MVDPKFFDLGAGPWYDTSSCSPNGAARLKAVVTQCAKTAGGSLFISAVESRKQDVMKAVVKGIKALAADTEVRHRRWSWSVSLPKVGQSMNRFAVSTMCLLPVYSAVFLWDEYACKSDKGKPISAVCFLRGK